MEKLQVRINQNLNRTEKTVALPLELEKIEETVLAYKHVCSTIHKKLCEYVSSAGKGTDGQSVERRLKKTSDFLLGQSLSDQGRALTKQHSSSCLGQVLLEAGGVCTSIGHNLVQYEISVEQLVIHQLETVLKTDLPSIIKQRKHLDQMILELDTAKARLATAQAEERQAGVISGSGKVEKCIEELDDIDRRVEMARDTLATDMMTFLAKDAELAGMIAKFLDFKLEYHTSLADQVKLLQPKIDSVLDSKRGYPIFKSSLSSHISCFKLPSGIAFPIQVCVSRLIALGLEEEGLFRLAAGSSKVKRFRAEIETPGLPWLLSLETADHHVLTAIIKSYLRDLPEPLFGAALYHDWLEAGQCDDTQERFDAIWNLLQHENLPRDNYRNIQYLFRFLHEVTKYEDKNKMSASNLAIVITPNVIWDCEGVSDPMDISVSSSLSRVVEMIIIQYKWFFQNDAQLPSWDHQLPVCLTACQLSPGSIDTNHLATPALALNMSQISPVPNTRERKSKFKKAPLPPSGDLNSPSSSPNRARFSGDNFTQNVSGTDTPPSSHRKTNSVETIDLHIPPSPASHHLYPSLPGKDVSRVEENGTHNSHQFPVPAPRSIKPAIPNKPEGISRNASMRSTDQRGFLTDKESTNL